MTHERPLESCFFQIVNDFFGPLPIHSDLHQCHYFQVCCAQSPYGSEEFFQAYPRRIDFLPFPQNYLEQSDQPHKAFR